MAQNIELFRFTHASSATMVLHHNISNNTIGLIEKSAAASNPQGAYLQSFILKRVKNGDVLISSPKKQNYFLHYNKNANTISFSEIKDRTKLEAFTWQVQFAGKGKVIISPLSNSKVGLLKSNGNTIAIATLKDAKNLALTNGKKVGDQYRFSIEKIVNLL